MADGLYTVAAVMILTLNPTDFTIVMSLNMS